MLLFFSRKCVCSHARMHAQAHMCCNEAWVKDLGESRAEVHPLRLKVDPQGLLREVSWRLPTKIYFYSNDTSIAIFIFLKHSMLRKLCDWSPFLSNVSGIVRPEDKYSSHLPCYVIISLLFCLPVSFLMASKFLRCEMSIIHLCICSNLYCLDHILCGRCI